MTHYVSSEDKLKEQVKKRFTTSIIGALSKFEEGFGHLWGENLEEDADFTAEQEKMEELWEEIRTQILDLGHSQQRKALSEIDKYDVKFKGYHYHFTTQNKHGGNFLKKDDNFGNR